MYFLFLVNVYQDDEIFIPKNKDLKYYVVVIVIHDWNI